VDNVTDAMIAAGICKSKGEARRLIDQGAVTANEEKVTDYAMPVPAKEFVLHKGKKVHVKIVIG
jgi:tyrosyl-tRNA synthetase